MIRASFLMFWERDSGRFLRDAFPTWGKGTCMSGMFFGEEMESGMFLNGVNHWKVRAEVAEMNLRDVPWREIKKLLARVEGMGENNLEEEVRRVWVWIDTHEPLNYEGDGI